MKKLVIFGLGPISQVAFECFTHNSDYEISAFTVDSSFITENESQGVPVVPFEELTSHFPPTEYHIFIAIGYQDSNLLRTKKVEQAKKKGYKLASYIDSSLSLCPSIKIGEHCFIMSQSNIQPRVRIGSNNFIWSGSLIGHHTQIGNNNWFTSACNIAGNVQIADNNFFAINATVGNQISIGSFCFLGANTLTTKSLPDESVIITKSDPLFRLKTRDFLKLTGMK